MHYASICGNLHLGRSSSKEHIEHVRSACAHERATGDDLNCLFQERSKIHKGCLTLGAALLLDAPTARPAKKAVKPSRMATTCPTKAYL